MPLTIVTLFSPITPRDTVRSILSRIDRDGVKLCTPEEFLAKSNESRDWGRPVLFVGTGGTEQMAVDILRDSHFSEPVIILAHDRSNSLPAALEIRAYADGIGIETQVIHDSLERLSSRVKTWIGYSEVLQKIRASRLGMIGEPSFWLVASKIEPANVKSRWGMTIENYDFSELTGRLSSSLPKDEKKALQKHMRESLVDVDEEELTKAAAVSCALGQIASEHRLDAVSLECFRLLEEREVSGCYALSRLNDSPSLVAGCEGDIPATFTMLVVKHLLGKASFMANVAQVDTRNNTVVLSHCTIPTSMAKSHETVTHFETGLSVGIRGIIDPQPITVFKIHGEDLTNWWVSSGEVIENLRNDTGCRTQLRVVLEAPVEYFLDASLANHHIVILGNHTEEIASFMEFAEIFS